MRVGERYSAHKVLVEKGTGRIVGAHLIGPGAEELFLDLAEFITTERLCCPFLHFALELDPDAEEVRLRLTGSEGVKEFLSMELAPFEKQNRS